MLKGEGEMLPHGGESTKGLDLPALEESLELALELMSSVSRALLIMEITARFKLFALEDEYGREELWFDNLTGLRRLQYSRCDNDKSYREITVKDCVLLFNIAAIRQIVAVLNSEIRDWGSLAYPPMG
jgi:hypothetical protein